MAEQAFLATPNVSGGGRVIASPFQWLFGGDDNLRIMIVNSASGAAITVQGRFWSKDRGIQPFVFVLTPTSDRVVNEFNRPLGDGYLLNLSLVASSGAPLVGQTYCMVQVIRGLSGAMLLLGCLLGGYVTAMQHIAFPGSPIQSSTEGEPYVRAITGSDPGAGSNVSESVPTGARWELLGLIDTLHTSGAAGTRIPRLRCRTPAGTIWESMSAPGVAPATDAVMSWGPNLALQSDAAGTRFVTPLGTPNYLLAGTFIEIVSDGFTVTDNWDAPVYSVREWLEVA